MSRKDLVCLGLIIPGIALFLYGSNYYAAAVGWFGVSFVIVGFMIKIFF
jgi:hypothetical protein